MIWILYDRVPRIPGLTVKVLAQLRAPRQREVSFHGDLCAEAESKPGGFMRHGPKHKKSVGLELLLYWYAVGCLT